jgi:hypothetical protein
MGKKKKTIKNKTTALGATRRVPYTALPGLLSNS